MPYRTIIPNARLLARHAASLDNRGSLSNAALPGRYARRLRDQNALVTGGGERRPGGAASLAQRACHTPHPSTKPRNLQEDTAIPENMIAMPRAPDQVAGRGRENREGILVIRRGAWLGSSIGTAPMHTFFPR